MTLRFGSVCSGIEAASVAWTGSAPAPGFECVFTAEISPFPSAVLAARFPDVPNLGDFTTPEARASMLALAGGNPGDLDLLVGGTPCQSFSVAGLRAGDSDARGNLTHEFFRLVGTLLPRWVVWENVPGVLSIDGGRTFASVLGAMAGFGYGVAWRVLDAKFFGVPQRRRRVFLVGRLGDDGGRAGAVLFEPESLRGNTAPRGKKGKTAATGPGKGAAGDRGGVVVGGGNHTHALTSEGFDASEDGTGRGTPVVAVPAVPVANILSAVPPPAPPPVPFSVSQNESGYVTTDAAIFNTVTTNSNAAGRGNIKVCVPVVDSLPVPPSTPSPSSPAWRVRRITPEEAEALQGFPRGWTDIQIPLKSGRGIRRAADAPRYAGIGNSMATPVMRWIGLRLAAVDTATENFPEGNVPE